MKKLFLIMAIAGFSISTNAQTKKGNNSGATNFSIGLEGGLPVGQYPKGFDNPYSSVFGASLQVENHVAPEICLTLNAGYLSYGIKHVYQSTGGGNRFGVIPVMGGLKYYFSPSVFAHAQLGAGFGTSSGAKTSFAYSPGIGLNISQNLDAELKYFALSNSNATLGSVGLRLAYNF